MSLSIKKSRPITVDGVEYRFQVSTTKIDALYNFTLNLSVQRSEPKGCVLQVVGLVTRDLWLDMSGEAKLEADSYPVILPTHVSAIIEKSMVAGWDPVKSGKAFVLETKNDLFFTKKL